MNIPDCLGFYVRGQSAAERDCETCPLLDKCASVSDFISRLKTNAETVDCVTQNEVKFPRGQS